MNYTKGEWEVDCKQNAYGDDCLAIKSGDAMVAIIAGFGQLADAQLIVSAPKLYEFVREMAEQSVPGALALLAEVEGK